MLAVSQVIHRTIEKFPGYEPGDFEVTAVEKGGSGRKFYRIRAADRSMILSKYTNHREENRHYVAIAQFLAAAGVQVPHVYFHDPSEGLIWMQDLGESDLWAHREEPWAVRRPLYESALIEVFKIHSSATRRVGTSGLTLQKEFNGALYRWEQSYFFEHCLGRHFGLDAGAVARLAALPALADAADKLAALPRVLVHRDFQSQNVIISDGTAWLIDFQGMRPGLAQYDVASLLYDPYVALTPDERCELLGFYARLANRSGGDIEGGFDEVFLWCAVQRLMQALGAYGYLGHEMQRAEFLAHIPAALRSLRDVATGLPGLEPLLDKIESLT